MAKPILLLDVDGVLVESNRMNLVRLNEEFGTDYKYEQITDWKYTFMQPQHRKYIYEVCWPSPTFYNDVELSQDILVTLEKLRQIVRVVACTAPFAGHIYSKYKFLQRHFDYKDIMIVHDKALINGDILVDDGPHNIKDFPRATIIYDRPWNQDVFLLRKRVHSFPEILPAVETLLS